MTASLLIIQTWQELVFCIGKDYSWRWHHQWHRPVAQHTHSGFTIHWSFNIKPPFKKLHKQRRGGSDYHNRAPEVKKDLPGTANGMR